MKTIIFLFSVLTFIVTTPEAQALFGHTTAERERRLQTEQLLAQEQQRNGSLAHTNERLHIVIGVLSAGAVATLIVGTMVGSKTRRDHETRRL